MDGQSAGAGGHEPGTNGTAAIRPAIQASWQRCREVYGIAPDTPPPDPSPDSVAAAPRTVVSAARSLAADITRTEGVVAVAAGDGRIVAVFGSRSAVALAGAHQLAPGHDWSENSRGTNALGTALLDGHAQVTGPEHWRGDLADWCGAGVAVADPDRPRPCAVLAFLVHRRPLTALAIARLACCAQELSHGLRRRRDDVLTELAGSLRPQAADDAGPLAVIDRRGRLVAANEVGHAVLGSRARAGALRLAACAEDGCPITVQPIQHDGQLIGTLLTTRTDSPPATEAAHAPVLRLAGIHGGHILLMAPAEIRVAQAEGKTVWLLTDRGRLRALNHTLNRLETRLAPHGFLRVHRHCVVNLHRVREIAPTFHGGFALVLDGPDRETVAVSRRHLAEVRRALGL
ncbi:LytTR family transcriptional regulator DNA-binding domain-containing protein [Amycolatopsis carbonis]|uniref:LytTR family transcriptional regulator DNA-binding domain-containing protein n=1 Tax=Amycolatopsis carbonis TaxID=715471 RepID=A0A9Y2MQ58_9PSEU|nr:DNA-binding protein [Amycolatopsis sp. 2-15]WIX76855.1 LytTR family transcriptional regulator DNA-binding domain-containing protein [Amycolatopsis sp. 2-15]